MDITKQPEWEQKITSVKKKAQLFNIIGEFITFGAGSYVGFMDGQGTPLEPAIKYSLLATPSVLGGAVTAAGTLFIQFMSKFSLNNTNNGLSIDDFCTNTACTTDEKKNLQQALNKIAYTNIMPNVVAKSVGKTALKTGIGYAVGYCLGRLI